MALMPFLIIETGQPVASMRRHGSFAHWIRVAAGLDRDHTVVIDVAGPDESGGGELPSREGFAGVIVTAGGVSFATIAPERALGIAAVLGCAVAYALSIVLLRQRAKRGDPPLTIALFQSAIPAAILALPAALFWAPIASADWPAFILIGALGLAGHVALALAFARGEASRLVAVEYTGLIWAILIGLVFFAEMPTPQAMLGAALIIGACWLLRR